MRFLTKFSFKVLLLIAVLILAAVRLDAQNLSVSGIVSDQSGTPLSGVAVIESGTNNADITDLEGKYRISVKPGATLEFSCLGFATENVKVEKAGTLNLVLKEDTTMLEDAVVVGYGVQKKTTLTGSVASVAGGEIAATKNSNAQNMLTGKVAGLRVVQTTSEPGTFNSSISIRNFGSPLVIIDGVPRQTIGRLNANDIESMSVIKDASAAVYGVKAADGVIIITTKQGKKDRMSLDYEYNLNISTLTGLPRPLDATQYMTLYNEQGWSNYERPAKVYSDEDMAAYANGEKVSTDWYGNVVRNLTPSHQHTLSATGGTDRTNYYMSLSLSDQNGFYRDGGLDYTQYSFRSNVSSRVLDDLTVSLNLWANMDTKNEPYESSGGIIRSLWRQRPTDPIYANDTEPYFFKTTLDGYNPIAMSKSNVVGYNKSTYKMLQSMFSMEYKPSYVPGLSAKVSLSYDTTINDYKTNRKAYNLYVYNDATGEYRPNTLNSPSRVRRSYATHQDVLFNAALNYQNTFGKHSVSAMFLYEEEHQKGDNFYAQRDLSLNLDQLFAGNALDQEANMSVSGLYEYVSAGFIGRANYDYGGKYLVEVNGRYDQSSKFSPRQRGGFFFGGSIGYRISEEDFWKNNAILSSITNLKIRASYGKMGRDNALDFQYLTGYTYPSSGYVFNGVFIAGLTDKGLANENITWENCYTTNFGIDAEAWNGLLGVTFDAFTRLRKGIFGTRSQTLPNTTGTTLPQENLNGEQTTGWDMSVSHHNNFGEFRYSVTGNLSYAFTKNLYRDRAKAGNSYENWYNNDSYRNQGIWFGLAENGQYQNWNEIYNDPLSTSYSQLPGDYKYVDWNEDGYITDADRHIIGYSADPQIYYGLTIELYWKGIDFNMLWQGAARHWVAYTEILGTSLWGGGNSPAYFYDRWHPVDPDANPYDPTTKWISGTYAYAGRQADVNSEHRILNAAYLRLKSVDLGYTLPSKWTQKAHIESLRIFANIYNPLTFSGIKHVDPEHTSQNNGYIYPINTTYNLGIQLKFR